VRQDLKIGLAGAGALILCAMLAGCAATDRQSDAALGAGLPTPPKAPNGGPDGQSGDLRSAAWCGQETAPQRAYGQETAPQRAYGQETAPQRATAPPRATRAEPALGAGLPTPPSFVMPVAYRAAEDAPPDVAKQPEVQTRQAVETSQELDLEGLIAEVQAVNPSVEAAVEAWQAAAYRYPQMIALEDPMLGVMAGTRMGWMVEASQRIPWPGKRRLRGNVSAAEANAMEREVDDVRRMLAEAAAMAFFDYYQADRQLAVLAENTELMRQFRDIAKRKYEAGLTSEQDVLQAEVELADLEARGAELHRERRIAAARINTLLHREPGDPLASPPAKVEVGDRLLPGEALVQLALEARPDLAAQMARIRADEYALGLAWKEYYPDVEIAFKHDAFMPEEMRTQVGVGVNVPLWREKRQAAVCEASARLRQRRAELESRIDRVGFEVQSSWERVAERHKVVRLFEQRILPAARANVESARVNYVAGKLDFLRLVEAQRGLREQQDKYHQTVADYHRRLAELQRAVAAPLPEARGG